MVLHTDGDKMESAGGAGFSGVHERRIPGGGSEERSGAPDADAGAAAATDKGTGRRRIGGEDTAPVRLAVSADGSKAVRHERGCLVAAGPIRDIETAASYIPMAKVVSFPVEGAGAIVMRHGVHETRILRNMGWPAQAPILHSRHAWTGPFKPFAHQRATAAFIVMNERGYVLNDPGTGKTASVVWAGRFLRRLKRLGLSGGAGGVLVVAPLSTLRDVWEREIRRLDPDASVAVLHGAKRDRLALLAEPHDWYVINHDGVKVIADELAASPHIDMVVIDECTAFKNYRTQRWKAMNKVCQGRRIIAMTGTPMAQSPLDVFGQVKLVTPETVPKWFSKWREMVATQVAEFQWVPRNDALEKVRAALRPSIRVERSECIDMPDTINVMRCADLSPQQQRLAQELRQQWFAELETTEITAVNAAARLTKLLQIAMGAVINDNDEVSLIDASPREELLLELIDEAARDLIVFAPYRAVVGRISDLLGKAGVGHVVVHGGITGRERDRRFTRFREDGNVKVLVAHPKTTSHGLSFINADTVVWYGPVTSTEQYIQANARISRPGQQHNMLIYHIWGLGVEKELYNRLQQRRLRQDELLQMLKREVMENADDKRLRSQSG